VGGRRFSPWRTGPGQAELPRGFRYRYLGEGDAADLSVVVGVVVLAAAVTFECVGDELAYY